MIGRNAILHVAKPFSFSSEGLSMTFPKRGDYNIPHSWIGVLKAAGMIPNKATVKETVQLANPEATKLERLLKPGPAPIEIKASASVPTKPEDLIHPKKTKTETKTKTPDAAERAGIVTK